MSSSPIVYRPLTPDLKRGLNWRSLRYFGAGAIIASVTIGSGETFFASRGGALFGYTLLWCFAASAIMKGFQVYSASRYFVLTGEHPMTHWAYLPGPRNWVPVTIALLSLLCFPFWQAALPMMLGNIVNWILGDWVLDTGADPKQVLLVTRLWATLAIVVVVALCLLQSYQWLERAQVLIVGILLGCMFVAVAVARPDWQAALMGLFAPTVPKDYASWVAAKYPDIASGPPWVEIATYLGAVGGGTYDYLGYVGCFREKAWGAIGLRHAKYEIDTETVSSPIAIAPDEANLARARRWLLPVQIDVFVGFASVLVFAICFVLLGAKILNPQHAVPSGNDLLNHQAQFLTNIHPALKYLYQLGIFVAFFGTIYGAYEVYARTAFECLMPISATFRRIPFATFRVGIILYCAVLGLLFLWVMEDPVKMIRPAAIVGGVFTCGLWCLAMLWADRRFLPVSLQMRWPLRSMVGVSGVALTVMGGMAIWEYLADLLH